MFLVKLLISAAETSSDAHGAELIDALKKELSPDQALDVFGVGGPKLQAQGVRIVVDAKNLLVMGFGEIFFHLPRIFRSLRAITNAAIAERPDLAIVIDYPDFHFILAKRLQKLGIPVVYYIPPKVWAWRKHRVHQLKKYFIQILSILPFEVEFYKSHGIPVRYVGNPLIDELPWDLSQQSAREKLGLGPFDRVLVLMPGSRPSELKRHLILMLEAAEIAAKTFLQPLHVFMPFPSTLSLAPIRATVNAWMTPEKARFMRVHLSQGDAHTCLVAADAGLIKSGTSTLEAGLLRCCHAVVYRPSPVTAWIFKYLIRYRGPVGLVNLVTGWSPDQKLNVSEILCGDATPQRLAKEIETLLTDSNRRKELQAYFESVRNAVLVPESPSKTAAKEILSLLREKAPNP